MRPGGYQEKVWLLLDIKLNILQPADETYDTHHLDNLQHHHKVDAQIEDMFQHLGRKDPLSEEEYHVDAAKACRDVRSRTNQNACGADANRTCVFNVLLPTLDLLQRRAYEEVRHNVNIAVGHGLSAELMFLVFEHSMVAEKVPLDLRITLEAKHQAEGPTARKTCLLCEHPAQASPMSGSGYLHGDEWIELSPKWPHSERRYRQMENEGDSWYPIEDFEPMDCDEDENEQPEKGYQAFEVV
jgi:hypothetical protein